MQVVDTVGFVSFIAPPLYTLICMQVDSMNFLRNVPLGKLLPTRFCWLLIVTVVMCITNLISGPGEILV